MTQNSAASKTTLSTSSGLNTVGNVFCMTVDSSHSHENSSAQSSVSTLSTFIDQITLEDKVHKKKEKKILKTKKNMAYWSKTEIHTLVVLLRKYGSDFTMIATQMSKTRDQIKRKFKFLEKKNPTLTNAIFETATAPEALSGLSEEIQIEENEFFAE